MKFHHLVASSDQIHSGAPVAILYLREAALKDLHLLHIQVPADLIAAEVNQDLTLQDLRVPDLPVLPGLQVDHPVDHQAAAVEADHLQEEDNKLTVKYLMT